MKPLNKERKTTKQNRRRQGRKLISILTAVVVFVTTYALVLPAIAIETDTAMAEPGMDVMQTATEVPAEPAPVPEAPAPLEAEPVAVEVPAPEAAAEPAPAAAEATQPAQPAANLTVDAAGGSAPAAAFEVTANTAQEQPAQDSAVVDPSASADPAPEDAAKAESENAEEGKLEENAEKDLKLAASPFVLDYPEFTVTVSFGENAALPEGASATVREYAGGSMEYNNYHAVLNAKLIEDGIAEEDLNTVVSALRFFELSFKDKEGTVIRPAAPVDVLVEYKEAGRNNPNNQVSGETLYALTFRTDDGQPTKASLVAVNAKDGSAGVEAADGAIQHLRVQDFPVNDTHTNTVIGQLALNENVNSAENINAAGEDAEGGTAVDNEEESLTTQYLTADGEAYNITLTYEPEAGIPDGAVLAVSEIQEATDAYDEYVSKTEDAIGENEKVTFARFFDITIVKDGAEIQPVGAVNVKIELADNLTDEVKVVHFEHTDAEAAVEAIDTPVVLDSERVEAEALENAVGFEADSFSVFGIVGTTYTVDFEYSVNGKMYQSSLPGGGFVSFTDLVEVLGILDDTNNEENNDENSPENVENVSENTAGNVTGENGINAPLTLGDVEISDAARKFVADVEKIEFSNPELVDVSKVDADTTVGQIKESRGLECQYSTKLTEEQIAEINATEVKGEDWALISLKPFLSEETLTVTMKDGEVFTVKVTDAQLHTYVISDSGDTYEVIVTYDDTAEIPENAELKVREIKDTEEEYAKNIEATNKELQAQEAPEVANPVQFDITIVADGVEVEPKEGSVVRVEIRLAPEMFGGKAEDHDEEEEDSIDNAGSQMEEGEFWFNGEKLTLEEGAELTDYTVSHITDDGKVEIIDEVKNSVDEDENVVLTFDTESFSDYLMGNPSGLNVLPNTIRVGDEIYMWERAHYWVTNIGSVVDEIKHPNGEYGNDGSDWKTVRAINTGTFRIYNRYNDREYKDIAVLPAITETTPPGTINTIDNASIGLTLNLFDYDLDNYLDDYFNNYNHGNHPIPSNFLNHGINNGHALKFWGSGIGNNYGSANLYQEHGVTSIVQQNLAGGVGGYPQLRANSNPDRSTESLAYLFSPSSGTDKEAYTNVNHLFKREGDYYVYDSNTNYAYYDKNQGNGGNFAVYERSYKQKSGSESGAVQDKVIGFFPFHKWNEAHDLYVNWNKNMNHHFGMSMSVPFTLPKDPKAVKDSNGQPIVFEFSGDDDLWVFIDGKLAMDIGGIHLPTNGTINFMTGEVIVNGQRQTGFNFNGLYDGNKHTLQVFYIERGGCDSNCMIKFNMTQYGDVEFDKVDSEDNTLLAGAVFGLYKDDRCTIPLIEELKNGSRRAFIVETDENGHAKLEDVPLGDYYLKEIHAPDGYPIAIGDGTVRVRVYLDANGNVKTSVNGEESNAKILNTKPAKINLGLKKEWQDADGHEITAPDGVNATFEIKRIRTYETYTEREVQGHGEESSHLTVGWIHNGRPYEYEEFDLVAGSQATVSWSLADGYTGKIGCLVNGTEYTKTANPNNIYSQGITMPAAGQTAVIYIIDESENGDAIKNINVAGSQFHGNSGGGFIHEFHTITEPDPDFTYTAQNVTNNQVTLPINESTWQYMFSELPSLGTGTVNVGGKDQKVTYKYSYYIEEVSSTAPAGTTVIYKDTHGNVINSALDAETHTSGTETIINKVPFGYLKIEKKVTYNGSDQNLTTAQKSKLAGEYKFKIYTKEACGAGDAVQDPNAAADATDKDLIITVTIGENGQAVSSAPIKILAGKYWIKEVDTSNPAMFPVVNPIEVTVTKDHTTTSPVISTLTNNYDENNGPDKIAIDIEKKFQGLDAASQVPANFQVLLQYTVGGQTKTVTLQNKMATGENGEKITWTESADGFTWHWKVTNISSEAKNFKIKEENYDNAKGYDWKSATLNGTNITSTVTQYHDLTVTAPAATLSNVTNDRRTSDSGQNTEFYLEDGDILLTKLTANQGTLVISKHPLNLAERDAVVKGWPSQGGFKKPPHYFSIEEHPNGFAYGDKTVTFGEKNGKTTVKFTQNASAQETVFAVSYSSEEARNNANLVNVYEEVPIKVDIVKIDKNNETKKLPGAVFTIRQIKDAELINGQPQTMDGTTPVDLTETNGDGETSCSGLTHGYYEIIEKQAPAGYIKKEDTTFYFKIDSGVVTWLEKGTGKPSTWAEKTSADMVSFEAAKAADGEHEATNATFTVENEPGAALPNTGGPGTTLYTLSGLVIMMSAALMYGFRMRRRERRLN